RRESHGRFFWPKRVRQKIETGAGPGADNGPDKDSRDASYSATGSRPGDKTTAAGGDCFGWVSWANSWLVWLLIGGLALLMTLSARGEKFSAGADWFMHGEDFIKTYELVSIVGERRWNGTHLELTDQHGHRKEIDLRTPRSGNSALSAAVW